MKNTISLIRHSLLFVFVALIAASCSSSYSIKGNSDVSMLDGHILYLKAQKGEEIKNIDSCDVVHGQFHFSGNIDTVKVAAIFLDNQNLMPVVLEEGDITISINQAKQTCTGTELNNKLSEFTEKYNQLVNQREDLQHQHDQAIMEGKDMNAVVQELTKKAMQYDEEEEKLVLSFIEDNFDNLLGPFAFQMVTGSMQYPMYSPWIEALLSKATDKFKNDRYVKEFTEMAERNREIMNGMQDPTPAAPATDEPLPVPPTPNEMAAE